jgi:hypothetical protein
MLTAIDFDDKPILQANKVDHKAMSRCLASEVKTLIAPATKVIPDFHLLRRQRLT